MYKQWVQRKRGATCSLKDMRDHLPNTKPMSRFKAGQTVRVNNRMTRGQSYRLTANPARTARDVRTTYKLSSGATRTCASRRTARQSPRARPRVPHLRVSPPHRARPKRNPRARTRAGVRS